MHVDRGLNFTFKHSTLCIRDHTEVAYSRHALPGRIKGCCQKKACKHVNNVRDVCLFFFVGERNRCIESEKRWRFLDSFLSGSESNGSPQPNLVCPPPLPALTKPADVCIPRQWYSGIFVGTGRGKQLKKPLGDNALASSLKQFKAEGQAILH